MSENNTPGTGTNRPNTPPSARGKNRAQSRYGLRFDQMDPEELEYYRPFWDAPKNTREHTVPDEVSAVLAVRARRRLLNMMGLMILAVGLAIAGAGLFASTLPATFAGTLLSLAGVGCWVAVRRRLFAVLRAPGEEAVQRGEHSRWWLLPHLITVFGVGAVIASFTVVPVLYANTGEDLRRNYTVMWAEIGMTALIFAGLTYGMLALAAYTQKDEDERVLRPTDYAERQGTEPQIPRYRPGMLNPRDDDDR